MIYLNVFQIHCFLGIFRARMFLFQNKTSLVLSYLRNDTIDWIVITKTNKTVLMSNSIPGEIKRKVE